LPSLLCPGETVGLYPRIGNSGEKIEASKASASLMTRSCGGLRLRGSAASVSSTEDSFGSGCVQSTGQVHEAHASALTAHGVFLLRLRGIAVGMVFASTHRKPLKRTHHSSRERRAMTDLHPAQRRIGSRANGRTVAPHTQRIRTP